MYGAGRQPQSELERAVERIVAEGEFVVDGQCGEPHGRRPGSTAEYARLVLLCALQRAAPIVDVGNGPQAAMARYSLQAQAVLPGAIIRILDSPNPY